MYLAPFLVYRILLMLCMMLKAAHDNEMQWRVFFSYFGRIGRALSAGCAFDWALIDHRRHHQQQQQQQQQQ